MTAPQRFRTKWGMRILPVTLSPLALVVREELGRRGGRVFIKGAGAEQQEQS